MATWQPANLIVKGAQRAFHERLAQIPTIWQNHCAVYDSDTAVEPHSFPGFIPKPREFLNGRQIQGIRDFTFNITNNEYELSIAINRKHFEDDQTGLIAERMREVAEVWGTFKDYLFAQMLINGATAGYTAWDGTVFFGDTRAIGGSANIDNATTSAATTGTIPTAGEFIADLKTIKALVRRYQDDTGRPFNQLAVQNLRTIVPPSYEAAAFEALNAAFISQTENVFKGFSELDVCDYLTADTKMYITAVGAERKPFIMQQRMPLEVIILDSADQVALHNAVLVLARERFVFAYGEPRRAVEHTYS